MIENNDFKPDIRLNRDSDIVNLAKENMKTLLLSMQEKC